MRSVEEQLSRDSEGLRFQPSIDRRIGSVLLRGGVVLFIVADFIPGVWPIVWADLSGHALAFLGIWIRDERDVHVILSLGPTVAIHTFPTSEIGVMRLEQIRFEPNYFALSKFLQNCAVARLLLVPGRNLCLALQIHEHLDSERFGRTTTDFSAEVVLDPILKLAVCCS